MGGGLGGGRGGVMAGQYSRSTLKHQSGHYKNANTLVTTQMYNTDLRASEQILTKAFHKSQLTQLSSLSLSLSLSVTTLVPILEYKNGRVIKWG